MNGQRMDAAGKLALKRRIDHAVAFEPALSAEGVRYDMKSEVGLAAGAVSGVALVVVGFVLDIEAFGGEGLAQLFRDEILRSHDVQP
jgi:hypothetical protein